MDQYWLVVNLDKKEFIHPHKLGTAMTLRAQLLRYPSTGTALIVLLAAEREARGSGDFDINDDIAKRTIGRWAGDRIAIIGNHVKDSDLQNSPIPASKILDKCRNRGHIEYNDNPEGALYRCEVKKDPNYGKYAHWVIDEPAEFRDITDDVCHVIEHELSGKFMGKEWRYFKKDERKEP